MTDLDPNLAIEDYLDQHKYSAEFRYEHLYPMCGALWSAPVEQVGQIPYRFVVSFSASSYVAAKRAATMANG